MLSLRNFVVAPGNRRGHRVVYARLSDGSLRRVKDPNVVRNVLLRYDTQPPVANKWWARVWYWLLALIGR